MRGINRARKLLRRIFPLHRIFPRCIILIYHRVADVVSDPQLLCVSKTHFAEHLEYLQRYYHPMSLQDLMQDISTGKVPRYRVVVTFDDGYADNLWNATPLLERYNVPATVFVTTSYVGQNQEFWWDELERLLLLPEKLPEKLALDVHGELHKWDLHGSEEQKAWNDRWDVTMGFRPSQRHEVYKDLHPLLRHLEYEKRQQLLIELARWAGVPKDGRSDYLSLNFDELKTLGDNELVEIGSHTVTHSVLSAQPPDVRRMEIVRSKGYLEEILGGPVDSFSYPYGGADAVGEDTIRLVREAGYKVACANFAAPVTRKSTPYWLPRYLVRNWDGEEFARRLRRWFRG